MLYTQLRKSHVTGIPSVVSESWRLDLVTPTLALRLPDRVEILVAYVRPTYRWKELGNYRALSWQPHRFYCSSSSQGENSSGKFAVVRFNLKSEPRDEAKVEPTSEHEWYLTNNIESAKIKAAKNAIEKRELESEAQQIIQNELERLRDE